MTLGLTAVSISPPGAEIPLLAPPTQARCVSLVLVVQSGQLNTTQIAHYRNVTRLSRPSDNEATSLGIKSICLV